MGECVRPQQQDVATLEAITEVDVAHPDLGEGSKVSIEDCIDGSLWVDEAEVDRVVFGDRPIGTPAPFGADVELHHDRLSAEPVRVEEPSDVPEQNVSVQLVGPVSAACPSLSPLPEPFEDGVELIACIGKFVGGTRRIGDTEYHAGPFELSESLRQRCGRATGYASLDFTESAASRQQLSYHQDGPPLAENIGGLGHWAELTVRRHAQTVLRPEDRALQSLK
jgi:hypothetical protein